MPIAAAVMIYGGGTALAAGATGFAAFAAGAMVVGGSVSLVGTAIGDKNLERDGMIIGGLGSLGYGALELGGYSGTASNVAEAAKATVPGAATGAEAAAGTEAATTTGTLAQPGAVATPTPDIVKAIDASNTKFQAALEKMQKQNMYAQVLGGAGTAYSGYETAKVQEDIANKKLGMEQGIIDRQVTNTNNLSGLKLGKPVLPEFGSLYANRMTKTPQTA